MAGQRDRIIELKNYIESLGVDVNIGKNKAKGNKGFFKARKNSNYRIDIAKNLSDTDVLKVLIHEAAHYVHYRNDSSLKSLDFIFNNRFKEFEEDLISLTVDTIPKDFATELFRQKQPIKDEISVISKKIKTTYPDINLSQKNNKIQREISKYKFKHLLKYDRVKVLNGFSTKIYSIDTLSNDFKEIKPEYLDYIKLCSLKRRLSRINSKISRLNRYYNTPTELFARSFEFYALNSDYMKSLTPNLYNFYKEVVPKIALLSDIVKIVRANSLGS